MANNRMYLIHKPTKIGISMGARGPWGWYGAPRDRELDDFYEHVMDMIERDQSQDDFILAMEDCTDSSCFSGYTIKGQSVNEDGYFEFELDEEVSND